MAIKARLLGTCGLILAFGMTGCKPSSDPPPDIIKTQREALQKARAVGAVEQKSADAQQKAADEQTKSDDASASK